MVELATRVRVSTNAVAVAWLCGFIGGFGMMGMAKLFPPLAVIGVLLGAVSLWRLVVASKYRSAEVKVDESGLTLDGVLVMRKSEIQNAQYVPSARDGQPYVSLAGKKTASIAVTSAEQAAAILDALKMGVADRAASFNVVAQSALPVFGCMAFGLGLMMLGLVSGILPLAILGPILAVLAPILLVPAPVQVGTDGILWKSRLRSELFPFERIRAVGPTKRGIVMELTDGKVVDLPITSNFSLQGYEADTRAALLERIAEARARRDEAPAVEATVGWRLDRGERSIAEWLASFEADGAAFRDAAIRLDDLLEVLDDRSRAPAKERVAAAVLLAKRGGDEERSRIRVAAEAAVAPKLRVALDAIAEGKDAAVLEAAIREAEEEDATAQRAAPTGS